ncbi:MAG: TrmH family RNA methyltransferase [Bacteroidia bacterium]
MVTKNQIKFVQSLHRKKYRQKYSQFIVEGVKSVDELIHSDYSIEAIYATSDWINEQDVTSIDHMLVEGSKNDLERMSFFKSAAPVLAVVNQKTKTNIDSSGWVLCLDGINDPGNLGTIIRVADWYGIKSLVCSENTVDLYNPKTISSSMGSFTRVNVQHTNLETYLQNIDKPLFYTLLEGDSIYTQPKSETGIIVIGGEANGITQALLQLKHTGLTIPKLGGAESLNAGVAAAIICDRLLR